MAYTDFSLDDIAAKFGVQNRTERLFSTIKRIEISEKMQESLDLAAELPIRSEKAKSETIVFPLLVELRRRNNKYFTIYSGDTLNADEKAGLKGECDFILAKDVHSFTMNYPIIQVVEAKKNDIEVGVPQCAAQLIGAKIFNEKKGIQLEKIYGCVTTGDEWLFMCLEKDIIIDTRKYYLTEMPEIMGVFQFVIDYYKQKIN